MKLFKLSLLFCFVLCLTTFVPQCCAEKAKAADAKPPKTKPKAEPPKTEPKAEPPNWEIDPQKILHSISEMTGVTCIINKAQSEWESFNTRKSAMDFFICSRGFDLEKAMTLLALIYILFGLHFLMHYDGCPYKDALAMFKDVISDDEGNNSRGVSRSRSSTPSTPPKQRKSRSKEQLKSTLLLAAIDSPAGNTRGASRSRSVSLAPQVSPRRKALTVTELKKKKVTELEAMLDDLEVAYVKGSRESKSDKIQKIMENQSRR